MPELEQNTSQKRYIAYKVKISNILSASFIRDVFSAGYVNLNGMNISRVNIIATLINKIEEPNYASAVIDDGTGRISLRSFENKGILLKVDVGDIILAIGKIREFNNEKYLIPDIIRKINNIKWVDVRKLELEKNGYAVNEKIEDTSKLEDGVINIKEEVYSLIKKLDKSDGAPIDEVIKNSNSDDVENMVRQMLENGDIFEIRSGKLKVLE